LATKAIRVDCETPSTLRQSYLWAVKTYGGVEL